MKILFISVYEGAISFGLRCLSSVLKEQGIPVQTVFLPRETEGFRFDGFRYFYPEGVLDQVTKYAEGADLVGISVMSNNVENAVEVTQHLHNTTHSLVIWGGIHPTIRPEECLEYTDLVCVGEGEEAIVELACQLERGEGYKGIKNIYYTENGKVVRTPLRPLVVDLDRYPYPDYDLEDHFVLHQGKIQPMTEELLYYYLRWPYGSDAQPMYTTLMSRGCTWNCTYCNNNALKGVYHKEWKVRRRSVPNFIGEIKSITDRYPGIKWIKMEDDVFLDHDETVHEFSVLYKQNIKIPLWVTGFQPTMVTADKVGELVDAGMKRVRMGIQTGSIEIMHGIYKRPGSKLQLQKAFQVLNQFKGRIEPPFYDLIIDNPWETEKDCLDTLELLLDIPKPYQLILFSLTFYPGTELYERAKADGLIKDEINDIYQKNYLAMKHTYTNYLIKLLQFQRAPHWLIRFLMKDQLRKRNLIFLPYTIYKLTWLGRIISEGGKAIIHRDFGAFGRAFRARMKKSVKAYTSQWLKEKSPSLNP
jgi:anaerobic magnesium-protoporphyrin IX monomethyl ester cyclase